MMARFYSDIGKVFRFGDLTAKLTDSRPQPVISTAAVFGTAFAMFATCRGSLNGIDQQRHFPGRLRNFVGPSVAFRVKRESPTMPVLLPHVGRPPSQTTPPRPPSPSFALAIIPNIFHYFNIPLLHNIPSFLPAP